MKTKDSDPTANDAALAAALAEWDSGVRRRRGGEAGGPAALSVSTDQGTPGGGELSDKKRRRQENSGFDSPSTDKERKLKRKNANDAEENSEEPDKKQKTEDVAPKSEPAESSTKSAKSVKVTSEKEEKKIETGESTPSRKAGSAEPTKHEGKQTPRPSNDNDENTTKSSKKDPTTNHDKKHKEEATRAGPNKTLRLKVDEAEEQEDARAPEKNEPASRNNSRGSSKATTPMPVDSPVETSEGGGGGAGGVGGPGGGAATPAAAATPVAGAGAASAAAAAGDADKSGTGESASGKKEKKSAEKKEGAMKQKKGEARSLVEDLPPGFLKGELAEHSVGSPASEVKKNEEEEEEEEEEISKPTLRSRAPKVQAEQPAPTVQVTTAGVAQTGGVGEAGGATPAQQGPGSGKGGGKKGKSEEGAPKKPKKDKKGKTAQSGAREPSPPGEELKKGHEDWLSKGAFVEVQWGADWWQARAKRIKAKGGVAAKGHVCVSYVGGTSEDDEWIPISSGRLRKPQEDFEEEHDMEDGTSVAEGSQKESAQGKKKGARVGKPGGDNDAQRRAQGANQNVKWVSLGDEIVELLKDGPMGEVAILDRIGSKDTKRKKKLQALQKLIEGDFIVRQGAGTIADPYRYFVPDDATDEASLAPWINPNAHLHARLLQQAQAPQQVKQKGPLKQQLQQRIGGAGGAAAGATAGATAGVSLPQVSSTSPQTLPSLQQQRQSDEEALQAIYQQAMQQQKFQPPAIHQATSNQHQAALQASQSQPLQQQALPQQQIQQLQQQLLQHHHQQQLKQQLQQLQRVQGNAAQNLVQMVASNGMVLHLPVAGGGTSVGGNAGGFQLQDVSPVTSVMAQQKNFLQSSQPSTSIGSVGLADSVQYALLQSTTPPIRIQQPPVTAGNPLQAMLSAPLSTSNTSNVGARWFPISNIPHRMPLQVNAAAGVAAAAGSASTGSSFALAPTPSLQGSHAAAGSDPSGSSSLQH